MQRYVIAVLVNNQFGVLARVAGMFRRRGFNIDTLTVGETEDPKFSRMTISFYGDEASRKQVVSQLSKLSDVRAVHMIDRDNAVMRELVLIKIRNTPETQPEIMTVAEIFRARVVDYGRERMTVEITGETSKINAFIENIKKYGIIEICRTGIVALERQDSNLLSDLDITGEVIK